MAVVKVSYARSRGAAKATLRYITHRPGKDNERTTRLLFGRDGPLTKEQAYQLIDSAKRGTTLFRIMISPSPKTEDSRKDLNLRELTADALLALQTRLRERNQYLPDIQFLASVHADHRPHRHVHLIALIQGRLTKADINALRIATTERALAQRRERDLVLSAARSSGRLQNTAPVVAARMQTGRQTYNISRPRREVPHCPLCLSSPELQWRPGNRYQCPNCDYTVERTLHWDGQVLDRGWGI